MHEQEAMNARGTLWGGGEMKAEGKPWGGRGGLARHVSGLLSGAWRHLSAPHRPVRLLHLSCLSLPHYTNFPSLGR